MSQSSAGRESVPTEVDIDLAATRIDKVRALCAAHHVGDCLLMPNVCELLLSARRLLEENVRLRDALHRIQHHDQDGMIEKVRGDRTGPSKLMSAGRLARQTLEG